MLDISKKEATSDAPADLIEGTPFGSLGARRPQYSPGSLGSRGRAKHSPLWRAKRFPLCRLQVGEQDRLGKRVLEKLWVGGNYAIYQTDGGVHVQFSDVKDEEKEQRKRFTEICPELCELRYLTCQMTSRMMPPFMRRKKAYDLFAHNMAQAIMLVMEGNTDQGKQIAGQALAMAVRRITNDNTIRYLRVSIIIAALSVALGIVFSEITPSSYAPYIFSAMGGAIGAALSIATRLEAFELKPCNDSSMNKWMAAMRVGMGIIAGATLLLLATTILHDTVAKIVPMSSDVGVPWETAALLGLIGGFAERFIPNLLRRTAVAMLPSDGTPVQAVRREKSTSSTGDNGAGQAAGASSMKQAA